MSFLPAEVPVEDELVLLVGRQDFSPSMRKSNICF